jgi:hypothetical protein
MRLGFLLGLGLLACGGESGTAPFAATGGSMNSVEGGSSGASISDGGAGSKGGKPQGGAGAAGSGGATTAGKGGSAAGNSDAGGTSGASPGDGGASGAAAGDGGEAGASGAAPNDTGCVERPWTGNQGDLSEKALGLDCSSCSTGAELGYTKPSLCGAAAQCMTDIDVTELGGDDVFILLPPAAVQAATCNGQTCKGEDGEAAHLDGYVGQVRLWLPAGHTVRIDVDENRRAIHHGFTLDSLHSCAEVDASTCLAFGSERHLRIVAKESAPRGWARIRLVNEACE